MKAKPLLLLAAISFLYLKSYSQDTTRTINDKPGTPQSLKTAEKFPRNKVHVIKPGTQHQSINHGGTESNKIIQKKPQTISASPKITDGKAIPKTPITILNNPPAKTDTLSNKNSISNKPPNVTNPIRK